MSKNFQIHQYKQELETLRGQIEDMERTLNRLREENETLKLLRDHWEDSYRKEEAEHWHTIQNLTQARADRSHYKGLYEAVQADYDALKEQYAPSMPDVDVETSEFERQVLGVIYTVESKESRGEYDEIGRNYFSMWPPSQTKKMIKKGWITLDDGPGPYTYRLTDFGRAIFERLVEAAKR